MPTSACLTPFSLSGPRRVLSLQFASIKNSFRPRSQPIAGTAFHLHILLFHLFIVDYIYIYTYIVTYICTVVTIFVHICTYTMETNVRTVIMTKLIFLLRHYFKQFPWSWLVLGSNPQGINLSLSTTLVTPNISHVWHRIIAVTAVFLAWNQLLFSISVAKLFQH